MSDATEIASWPDDDFSTETIRNVDGMLRGEREQEIRECRECDVYQQELDEEYQRYWSEHCPEHGVELTDGVCMICVQEEQRADH